MRDAERQRAAGILRGRPRSGPLAELKCRARTAFRHEMKFLRENEDKLRHQSMLSKLIKGECNDFWKEIKELNPQKLKHSTGMWKEWMGTVWPEGC